MVYFFYQQLLSFSPLREIAVLVFFMHTSVVPKASPDTLPALAASLEPFAPLFRRATSRESVERSLTGLLTALERTNCDTMAAAVAGPSTARFQPLVTAAAWAPQPLDQQRVTALVWQSPRHGILVVDDTGLPKPGRASVGVARQYAGTLGKVAHGQVVVRVPDVADAPTSRAPVPWPLPARRSLPAGWAPEAARRRKVPVPAEVACHTKPALALPRVDQARRWGVPCAPVVADAGYGDPPALLPGLDDRQLPYVGGVSTTCGGRLPAAVQATALWVPPRPRGRGPPRNPRPAPRSEAQAALAPLPQERWQTSPWREDADVVLRTPCVALRVHWATGGAQCATRHHRVATGPEGWLLGERPVPGERGAVQWSCSNLPTDTPLQRLVELAHRRWPIEPLYADAKGECGLAHDQGRRWDGLHRQLALVLLAESFLARQRWRPADLAGCSPRRGAPVVAGGPPPGARMALPGCRVMAHREQPDCPVPSQTDLTK